MISYVSSRVLAHHQQLILSYDWTPLGVQERLELPTMDDDAAPPKWFNKNSHKCELHHNISPNARWNWHSYLNTPVILKFTFTMSLNMTLRLSFTQSRFPSYCSCELQTMTKPPHQADFTDWNGQMLQTRSTVFIQLTILGNRDICVKRVHCKVYFRDVPFSDCKVRSLMVDNAEFRIKIVWRVPTHKVEVAWWMLRNRLLWISWN